MFVGARYKRVTIHEIGSSPYILGDDRPQPRQARSETGTQDMTIIPLTAHV